MILKSYEIQKNKSNLSKYNFFLLYGENFGLKKDIKEYIEIEIKKKDKHIEISSLYETDILNNEENFFNSIFSGSLFSEKKIIIIHESTDKIINNVTNIYNKYVENVYLIFFSDVLEKKIEIKKFF